MSDETDELTDAELATATADMVKQEDGYARGGYHPGRMELYRDFARLTWDAVRPRFDALATERDALRAELKRLRYWCGKLPSVTPKTPDPKDDPEWEAVSALQAEAFAELDELMTAASPAPAAEGPTRPAGP